MSRSKLLCAAAIVAALSACTTQPVAPPFAIVATTTPPPPVAIVEVAPPPMNPINRNLSQHAAIWHVRAALNVAALACRGANASAIVARYNAMLTANAAPLKAVEASLSAEFQRGGGDWRDRYDDAMTRLYNFFSQSQGRTLLCATADAALAEAPTVASAWPDYADRWLPALDVAFVPPAQRQVIAVSATPGTARATDVSQPATQPVTSPAPRLTLDLPALTR